MPERRSSFPAGRGIDPLWKARMEAVRRRRARPFRTDGPDAFAHGSLAAAPRASMHMTGTRGRGRRDG